ncbi:unnamed protein product [Heterobilharzia americana]|nr:unnamed protein product [Heterobilharzia americana]
MLERACNNRLLTVTFIEGDNCIVFLVTLMVCGEDTMVLDVPIFKRIHAGIFLFELYTNVFFTLRIVYLAKLEQIIKHIVLLTYLSSWKTG